MTEDEWDDYRTEVDILRSQMARCQCACKCQYPLYSSRSNETHTCFSCRSKLHFGSGPVGAEVEAVE